MSNLLIPVYAVAGRLVSAAFAGQAGRCQRLIQSAFRVSPYLDRSVLALPGYQYPGL
jgi:hypothetical protein